MGNACVRPDVADNRVQPSFIRRGLSSVATKKVSILKAVKAGDLSNVKIALAQDPEAIKYRSFISKNTVWHIAAAKGDGEMISYLVSFVRQQASQVLGENAAHQAVDDYVSNYLNQTNINSVTPLAIAAYLGRADVVTVLVKEGSNIWARDECNRTPLHNAAMMGRVSCVKALLDHCLPYLLTRGNNRYVDARTGGGLTALHVAVAYSCHKVIIELLVRGASLTPSCEGCFELGLELGRGVTPLHVAAYIGDEFSVKALLLSFVESYDRHQTAGRRLDIRLKRDATMRVPYELVEPRLNNRVLRQLLSPWIEVTQLRSLILEPSPNGAIQTQCGLLQALLTYRVPSLHSLAIAVLSAKLQGEATEIMKQTAKKGEVENGEVENGEVENGEIEKDDVQKDEVKKDEVEKDDGSSAAETQPPCAAPSSSQWAVRVSASSVSSSTSHNHQSPVDARQHGGDLLSSHEKEKEKERESRSTAAAGAVLAAGAGNTAEGGALGQPSNVIAPSYRFGSGVSAFAAAGLPGADLWDAGATATIPEEQEAQFTRVGSNLPRQLALLSHVPSARLAESFSITSAGPSVVSGPPRSRSAGRSGSFELLGRSLGPDEDDAPVVAGGSTSTSNRYAPGSLSPAASMNTLRCPREITVAYPDPSSGCSVTSVIGPGMGMGSLNDMRVQLSLQVACTKGDEEKDDSVFDALDGDEAPATTKTKTIAAAMAAVAALSRLESYSDLCGVCLAEPPDASIVPCSHIICAGCALELAKQLETKLKPLQCPFCRANVGGFARAKAKAMATPRVA